MDGKEFYLISKFNEGEFSVVLLFDDSTTLVGIKILFGVGIVDYSYLIHKKIEEFITGITFTGRLTCSLVSTEEVSPSIYGIPKEEVTPAVGYVFDKYVSVIDTTSLEELFVEETGTHIIVNKPLDNATINVYFNYRCNIKINQGLDFVEIEKTPALVVDDYVLNQSISLPDMIQVFGYAGITEDKKDIIKGYSCEAQRGVSLDFNLIIASTLFYDTLVIWDTLYSNSFCNIPLPEVGGHILVEMVSPSRETTPILTEGGRVLYKRVSLKFPYPIKVTEGKVVNSLNIELNSLGGYNANRRWVADTIGNVGSGTVLRGSLSRRAKASPFIVNCASTPVYVNCNYNVLGSNIMVALSGNGSPNNMDGWYYYGDFPIKDRTASHNTELAPNGIAIDSRAVFIAQGTKLYKMPFDFSSITEITPREVPCLLSMD